MVSVAPSATSEKKSAVTSQMDGVCAPHANDEMRSAAHLPLVCAGQDKVEDAYDALVREMVGARVNVVSLQGDCMRGMVSTKKRDEESGHILQLSWVTSRART